ncbi:MAG: hypothetical protein RMJ52_07905 [Gemmataceae bacterium]|nr:hypothetical protein [Gemmataceae bacterium]
MPGDAFKKVQPGQRLEITAEAYNAFLDAALAVRQHKQFGTEPSPFFRQSGIIKVKNVTGVVQNRFAVLSVAQPVILPAENLNEFKRQVTFEVGLPTADASSFCILLEPLDNLAIGTAVVAGVAPVRLLVTPARLYQCASPIPGDSSRLRNTPHGPARVLWQEMNGLAERWAIVAIDASDMTAVIRLTSDSPGPDGYYDGEVQRFNVATGTWQTWFPCKVTDLNS